MPRRKAVSWPGKMSNSAEKIYGPLRPGEHRNLLDFSDSQFLRNGRLWLDRFGRSLAIVLRGGLGNGPDPLFKSILAWCPPCPSAPSGGLLRQIGGKADASGPLLLLVSRRELTRYPSAPPSKTLGILVCTFQCHQCLGDDLLGR